MTRRRKIDVHSHFVPESYRKDCLANGQSRPDGVVSVPMWTEERHLEMMDSLNIEKAYLSISSPGTHLVPGDDELARRVTRDCNIVAAQFKRRFPDRIGFFASTPLPDIPGTLAEIEAAFGPDFEADGVALKTNHHGTYLGEQVFDSVMEALDRKKATVFIHPTTPCSADGHAAVPLPKYPQPMLEFFFDTVRAVTNLFLSGTVSRYPNITYILSHCGGALPPMIRRICGASPILGVNSSLTPEKMKAQLNQQFYFDTAGWPFPEQALGLLQWVTPERVLYGSDFPWAPIQVVTEMAGLFDKHLPEVVNGPEEEELVCKGNALRLLQ